MTAAPPRLVVAGAGGDSGKTLVSLGLVGAWRREGLRVAAFKKGPDYIDAAWLSRAAARPARNLDVFLMGEAVVRRSFCRFSARADIAVVEGNRGLLDGYEGKSTAALAGTLDSPVLLVIDVTKVTRTAAAVVAGCRSLSPRTRLAGVIANRVGGRRHALAVCEAIEEATGIPVLGTIPRIAEGAALPDRHLGLVPPLEHGRMGTVVQGLADLVREHLDLGRLREIAEGAGDLPDLPRSEVVTPRGEAVRVGVVSDSAFSFYYPENLEALAGLGAEIVTVSALEDRRLPEIDLLYVGGGFPETHAAALSANRPLFESLRRAVRSGLPVYAECGGLIWLSRSVSWRGVRADLAGILDVDIVVLRRPQGHGYTEMVVDRPNPFFAEGTVLRGHEFHYARLAEAPREAGMVLTVRRGRGSLAGRDGLVTGNVFASFNHLHALGTPEWAPALIAAARRARERVRGEPDTAQPLRSI